MRIQERRQRKAAEKKCLGISEILWGGLLTFTDLDGFTEILEGVREALVASWLNELLHGQNHCFVNCHRLWEATVP